MNFKIKQLFQALEQHFKTTEEAHNFFSASKMSHRLNELSFGFFPLGNGIMNTGVNEGNPGSENFRVMVLGNDFGTVDYLTKGCPDKREKEKNPTIRNLFRLNLNPEETFCTNFYMGVRTEGTNVGPKTVTPEYQRFCSSFLGQQLEIINPKMVLCLGNEVTNALAKKWPEFVPVSKQNFKQLFAQPQQRSFVVKKEGRKFVFIPHPSYAHINWNEPMIAAINEVIAG